jgi:hypothetical protein
MLEGSRLRGVMPKNQSRLWLRRCHRRQLPHTGVSVRLEPLAFPYQHEPPPEPDPKAYVASSSTSTATVRFRPYNGRSAFAAGTALHAPKQSFLSVIAAVTNSGRGDASLRGSTAPLLDASHDWCGRSVDCTANCLTHSSVPDLDQTDLAALRQMRKRPLSTRLSHRA